ncbi:hypothetical protein NDA14_007900 [Ustilago hordei]|nr:hypothetical protein NDA14_007900 [Ustilago hordei]
MTGSGRTDIVPRDAAGDEWAILDTVEGSEGEVMSVGVKSQSTELVGQSSGDRPNGGKCHRFPIDFAEINQNTSIWLISPNTLLMTDLTKMKKIAKSTLLNEVRRICMFQANIQKLIADINKHWAKAKSMGHALPKILKVKTLIDQASMTAQMDHRTGNLKSAQANLADREVKNEEA